MPDKAAPMDLTRFSALADAYGGRVQTWPEAERSAALAFAQSEEGKAVLHRAAGLDSLLAGYEVPPPSIDLHARIVQAGTASLAPRARARRWWLGFGLAGVGLAGALAGTLAIAMLDMPSRSDHFNLETAATAFGDTGTDADTSEEGS